MHTHHSHSGQFCQHAKDSLREVIDRALELRFQRFCITEHIPRLRDSDLYPEEIESQSTPETLKRVFDAYFKEARRLQREYEGRIEMLVGFECEGIIVDSPDNGEVYIKYVKQLIDQYNPDLFVGSVHHVGGIPIDYTAKEWNDAAAIWGVEGVYRRYFEQQYRVITELSPPVIGHFDLVRLFSPEFDLAASESVWPLVVRNIEAGITRGCLFELNTAALSKGWQTPYPQPDLVKLILAKGGKFCASDDSHGTNQVGRHYSQLADYIDSMGIRELWTVGPNAHPVSAAEFRLWTENDRS